MRDYEIVYIFRSSLTPDEIEAKLERFHAVITTDDPGEVTASVHWGRRQLAYPIQKQRNGYYVVAQFTSAPDPLQKLERVLKLEDALLRYLIVIREHPWPLPDPAPTAPAPKGAAVEEAGAEEAGAEEAGAEGAAAEEAGAEGADAEEASEAEAEVPAEDADAEQGDADAGEGDADAEQGDADADAGEPEESAGAKEE